MYFLILGSAKLQKKSHICKFSLRKNRICATNRSFLRDFFHFRLINIEFFRRVITLDRLRLYHAARVAFLPVLAFRRHRSRHVASRKQGGYCRHCHYTDYYFSHNFFLLLVDSSANLGLLLPVVCPFGGESLCRRAAANVFVSRLAEQ